MTDNQNIDTATRQNVQRYMLTPLVMLILMIIFRTFNAIHLGFQFVEDFNSLLDSMSSIITIFNAIIIVGLMIGLPKEIKNKSKPINIGVSFANIVLVNNLFYNSKIDEFRNKTESFFAGQSFSNLLALAFLLTLLVLFLWSLSKMETGKKSAHSSGLSDSSDSGMPTQSPDKNSIKGGKASESLLFYFILIALTFLSIAGIYVIINPDISIISFLENSDNIWYITRIILIVLMAIVAIPVFLSFAAWIVWVLITKLPNYYRDNSVEEEKIVKAAFSVCLAIILIVISNIGIDWNEALVNLDSNKLALLIPAFMLLVYVAVAFIIVELIDIVLHGRDKKMSEILKKAAELFGHNLMKYCADIVKNLQNVISLLPNLADSLYSVLFSVDITDDNKDDQTL